MSPGDKWHCRIILFNDFESVKMRQRRLRWGDAVLRFRNCYENSTLGADAPLIEGNYPLFRTDGRILNRRCFRNGHGGRRWAAGLAGTGRTAVVIVIALRVSFRRSLGAVAFFGFNCLIWFGRIGRNHNWKSVGFARFERLARIIG